MTRRCALGSRPGHVRSPRSRGAPAYGARSRTVAAPEEGGAALGAAKERPRGPRSLTGRGCIVRIFELSTHVKSISRGTGPVRDRSRRLPRLLRHRMRARRQDPRLHPQGGPGGLATSSCPRARPHGRPTARSCGTGPSCASATASAGQERRAVQGQRRTLAREFMFSLSRRTVARRAASGGADRLPGTWPTPTASRRISPSTSPAGRAISAISIATC